MDDSLCVIVRRWSNRCVCNIFSRRWMDVISGSTNKINVLKISSVPAKIRDIYLDDN
jgi:hypothetical protein